MPLFRFHRGNLQKSLETTIIVKTFTDVVKQIVKSFDMAMLAKQNWGARLEIQPYPDKENNFDGRTGWYMQIVLCNIYEPDKMHIVGFLSEPLE